MTERTPNETIVLKRTDRAAPDWDQVRARLAASPLPDTPGGHIHCVLGTAGADGRPYLTRVGVRWFDGDLYFLSASTTRKSRNLAVRSDCAIALHLDEFDLTFDGEALPVQDPAVLDAVGDLIRHSGWPVERTEGGFTAPFGPPDTRPPWQLYRFAFDSALGQGAFGAIRWRFAG